MAWYWWVLVGLAVMVATLLFVWPMLRAGDESDKEDEE
jgi:hypothetical protein